MNKIPFKQGHLDFFEMRQHERESWDVNEEFLISLGALGLCETIEHDGKLLAICGMFEVHRGVMQVFIYPSIHVKRYAKTYYSAIKTYIKWIHEAHVSIHRVQTCSKADSETDRWMKHLGFTYEGTLVKYTKDQVSYNMWAQVH